MTEPTHTEALVNVINVLGIERVISDHRIDDDDETV